MSVSARCSSRRAALLLQVALLIMGMSARLAVAAQVDAAALQGFSFQPMELRFAEPAPVHATFTSPHGKKLELATFAQSGSQVVRFTPTEAGLWQFEARASGDIVRRAAVQVARSRSHGFVRAREHAFRYDDGTPFIALGENRINIYDRSWNWGTLGIEAYIEHMARNGMSVLRVFIVSDVENEERGGANAGVLEPAIGQFDEKVAAQFDAIFRAAQAHDIYVVLVAFALGFSENDAWKSWQDNPYSKARGGPAATRYEFFDSPAVREVAARRIRYLAARYAASPNLLAIDLLNEPEWDGAIPEVSWKAWAQEMARAWAAADPYGHMVTVGSVGLHWNIEGDERDWWSSAECDVVQWHLYGKEFYEVHALAQEMTRKVRETWGHGKPVLVGEFAYGGEPKPGYDHTHVGLWSALFSGAGVLAHSAPPFNIDSDELMTPARAKHFRVLRDFFKGMPALEPGEVSTNGASAWALVGQRDAALWLLAPETGYGETVQGVRVDVQGLADGRWRIEWIDDVSGHSRGTTIAAAARGHLQAEAPPFERHIAARLTRHAVSRAGGPGESAPSPAAPLPAAPSPAALSP
jgi:hypothetical protein